MEGVLRGGGVRGEEAPKRPRRQRGGHHEAVPALPAPCKPVSLCTRPLGTHTPSRPFPCSPLPQNAKMYATIGVCVAFLIYFILAVSCGASLSQC